MTSLMTYIIYMCICYDVLRLHSVFRETRIINLSINERAYLNASLCDCVYSFHSRYYGRFVVFVSFNIV